MTALGVGLGTIVDQTQNTPGGVPYLDYVAPGLLAAAAMQTAAIESSWPVMAAIKWSRVYHAMIATPLTERDAFVGHQLFVITRVFTSAAAYLVVIAAFGAVASWWGILIVPVAVLVGTAFSMPMAALAAGVEDDRTFVTIFRFLIVPMFLFSGTFFPISQLPLGFELAAYVTPIWHGVELCRMLTLGTVELGPRSATPPTCSPGRSSASSWRGARTAGGCSDDARSCSARSICRAAAASISSSGT